MRSLILLLVLASYADAQCSGGRCSATLGSSCDCSGVTAPCACDSGSFGEETIVRYGRTYYRGADGDYYMTRPAVTADVPNYGLDTDKLSGVERWSHNGREVNKRQAMQAITPMPDDAGKPWAIAVVPAADKAKTLTSLAPLSTRYRVQVYDSTDWHLTDNAGKVAYLPGLTILAPDGTPVARASDIEAGKLRVLDPKFDPSAVPDLSKPAPAPDSTPFPTGLVGIGAAWAGTLALFFMGKK
jgi:hypothetical protein